VRPAATPRGRRRLPSGPRSSALRAERRCRMRGSRSHRRTTIPRPGRASRTPSSRSAHAAAG
jgi:hypothetical protein